MKQPREIIHDMIGHDRTIVTPAHIRPTNGRWIECPKCYGMPNQAYNGHCTHCKDAGVIRV